ncbi:MAG: hypothetical protein SNG02_08285 [Rikenellaceae bacterium]
MNNIALEHYKERLSALDGELKGVKRVTSRLYLVRFISFLLFIAMFVLLFAGEYTMIYIVFTLLFLALFVAVAIYDLRMVERRRELENSIKFNGDEIKTLHHEFSFREDGVTFSGLNPQLSGDFDIFGAGSLYQYLNRCVTIRGRSRFAASLVACDVNSNIILERTEAIKELSSKVDFIEKFATVGCDIKESGEEVDNLLKWLETDNSSEIFINVTRYLFPLITLSILLLSILGYTSYSMLSLTFLGSLIVLYANSKKLNKAHALLGRGAKILDKYSDLIKVIENEDFCSKLLSVQKRKLSTEKESASSSIRTLKSILDRFDYRYNTFVSVVLNGYLLFDYHTYMSLLKWKREHQEVLERWFDAVTQIDSLLGLGVYAYNCSNRTTYADVADVDFKISAQNMRHPLIPSDASVSNSIEISGRPAVVIITGANMAGKSTFLRTVATNLILGMNGAPVCSESFSFSPIKILSSIKIQDSLMNRESYFYAELLRLSDILEQINDEPQSMIILDEILRGTNTKDKQQGSIGLLRKIIENRGVAIIATHDLTVGKMEDEYPDYVSNYCFEVEIDGDLLSFDYKLKGGISSKLNASLLMRRMGIID